MLGSQPFVYVVQLNRFYSMPLLLLALTMTVMWLPGHPVLMLVATAILTVLTVLSHNITIAFFGLAFLAALAAFVVGRAPWRLVLRSGVALAVSGIVYVAYLRPIISGWSSTGNPTPVLVSYAAYLGVPTLALALFGASLVLLGREGARAMTWWLLIFAGSFCVFFVAQFNFNPRYFLFFFTAAWVLAAHAMSHIAGRLGRGLAGGAWYACVAVLLLPGLMSHFQDGSRHDYRRAAAVVVGQAQPGEQVLSDDAETISYYLPDDLRQRLLVRTKVRPSDLPASSFLLVARSNAWMPQPQYADRRLGLLAEISTRRFDQFSHVLRVYRVAAAESP
jgi:hypothetical protein